MPKHKPKRKLTEAIGGPSTASAILAKHRTKKKLKTLPKVKGRSKGVKHA
jgi:hypothetical protein